jgi:hypothetical protein
MVEVPPTQPQPSLCDSTPRTPRLNRLTIAHLLLWMTTTAVVLVSLRSQQPPPAERIGFASFLHQARSEEEREILFKERQQQVWRRWNARHFVRLAFAPVSGVALAAAIMALWRAATSRFGFPVQPGHWLLVAIAGLIVLAALRSYLLSLISRDGTEWLITVIVTGLLMAITYFNREPFRWRIAFAWLTAGFGTTSFAFAIQCMSPAVEPSNLFGLGMFLIGLFPFVAILCTAFDIAQCGRYDIFHWIGIATLLGVLAHIVALLTMPGLVR